MGKKAIEVRASPGTENNGSVSFECKKVNTWPQDLHNYS